MVNSRTKLTLLVVVISLSLSLLTTLSLADNGLPAGAQRAQIAEIILDEYNNLPNETLNFADELAVTFDGVKIRPYGPLALSEANLADGIPICLVHYEEKTTVLVATKLPDGLGLKYASGIVDPDPPNVQTLFVSKVDFESLDQTQDELTFELKDPGGDSGNLTLEVTGIKYRLITSIPKSL